MTPDADDAPRARWPVIALAVLALYLLAYFPAFSYMVRHPEHQRFSACFRPIPNAIRGVMFGVWAKLDPAGYAIVDAQAAAHPEDPAAVEALAQKAAEERERSTAPASSWK